MIMIEALIEARGVEGIGAVESFDFRTQVEINGLPYIFKGSMALVRKRFDWRLVTPDMEDYRISSEPSAFFDNRANEVGYVWYGNAAGYLRVDAWRDQSGLYLTEIRSSVPTLSKKSRHYNASGVGNFLLHNLLTVADRKGEPVYLSPAPPPDGKLNKEETIAWYERNDFQHLPPEKWQPSAKMVRYPNPDRVHAS